MSRVLVLGGTGSIGRLVVARLLELDDQPRVLTRDPDRAHRVLPDTAELVAGDLNDTAGVAAALDGVDRLFSLTRNLKVAPWSGLAWGTVLAVQAPA